MTIGAQCYVRCRANHIAPLQRKDPLLLAPPCGLILSRRTFFKETGLFSNPTTQPRSPPHPNPTIRQTPSTRPALLHLSSPSPDIDQSHSKISPASSYNIAHHCLLFTPARSPATVAMVFNSGSPYPEGVISFLDTDLYKLTMQCAVLKYFPKVEVTYAFKNRTPEKKLSREAFRWLQAQVNSTLQAARSRPDY